MNTDQARELATLRVVRHRARQRGDQAEADRLTREIEAKRREAEESDAREPGDRP